MSGRPAPTARVFTLSDRAAAGEMRDESGPALREQLRAAGFDVPPVELLADDAAQLRVLLGVAAREVDLIVTTGGTGLTPRDVTPQAVLPLLDYEVPGLGELMRQRGLEKTPMSTLSRSLGGVLGTCLILCLPGSVAGAGESLEAVLPLLPHAIGQLQGRPTHH
ncbi:MAG: MogA/MoaB family molybdenum cofactor biosynthesis protein [Candidatus Dormibacteraceae bacterium]